MISEVETLGQQLSVYYSPIYVMEGAIVPYEGLAIIATGINVPPGQGHGIFAVDIQIQGRTTNFLTYYKIAGFLANYRGATGPVTMTFGQPDPNIGGAECMVSGSLLASEIIPDSLIDLSGVNDPIPVPPEPGPETTAVYVKFVAGELEIRAYQQIAP